MFDKQAFPIEPAWIFNLSSISRWLAFEDSRHLWRRTPVLSARPTLPPQCLATKQPGCRFSTLRSFRPWIQLVWLFRESEISASQQDRQSVQQRSEGRSSGCFPPVRATWGLSCPAGSRPHAGRLLQARLLLIRRLSTELKAAPDCQASSQPQKQSLLLVTAPPAGAEASLSLPAASYQPDNIRWVSWWCWRHSWWSFADLNDNKWQDT